MQTFLPYQNYRASAQCLDHRRLGKQRVETWQIYRALIGETKGWVNHPATKMWRGFEWQLLEYGIACCDVWIQRGYSDTLRDKMCSAQATHFYCREPWWLTETELCLSHRSNLLRKQRDHYIKYFDVSTPDDLPYIWPSKLTNFTEKSMVKSHSKE